MSRRDWRYIAMRLNGDGTATTIHPELPISNVEIGDVLSAPNTMSGTLSPEFPALQDAAGRPLLDEWSTAIFAEYQGEVYGGGIVTDCDFTGSKWNVNCVGLMGYFKDMPFTGANDENRFFVETDTLDIVRAIASHVQGQEGSNIGLEFGTQKSGVKTGTKLTAPEYDPNGPKNGMTLESQAYKLAWYQDFDLLSNIDDLAEQTPFDYHERHWWDGDTLRHVVDFGLSQIGPGRTDYTYYGNVNLPAIGAKRADLRFVVGENVFVTPTYNRVGADYANEVYFLGSGTGSGMKKGHARTTRDRLRRVAIVSDSSVRSVSAANRKAQRELAWRKSIGDVGSLTIRDHPHAPVGALSVGDEIYVEGNTGWVTLGGWSRVIAKTIHPDTQGAIDVTLVRSDRITT